MPDTYGGEEFLIEQYVLSNHELPFPDGETVVVLLRELLESRVSNNIKRWHLYKYTYMKVRCSTILVFVLNPLMWKLETCPKKIPQLFTKFGSYTQNFRGNL